MIIYRKTFAFFPRRFTQIKKKLKLNALFYLISRYSFSFSVAVPAAVGLSFFSASACGFCGGPPRFASARNDGVPRSALYLTPAV
jgi:hypothetical protein